MTGGDAERGVSDEGEVGGKEDGDGSVRKLAAGASAGEAQMDYKTFLDLVLAMDNKQTRQVRSGGFVGYGCDWEKEPWE